MVAANIISVAGEVERNGHRRGCKGKQKAACESLNYQVQKLGIVPKSSRGALEFFFFNVGSTLGGT